MMRLVDMTTSKNKRVFHFEDKEAKEEFKMSEEEIDLQPSQLNNSFFTSKMLGIAWQS